MAEGLGRRAADRGDLSRSAAHPAAELARAVGAREDDPVVAADVDGLVAERLDRDERDVRHHVPRSAETVDELLLLPGRTRDDDVGHAVLVPSLTPAHPRGHEAYVANRDESVPGVRHLCAGFPTPP